MTISVSASIAAQNTYSNPITLKGGGILTLSGTFVATVNLQRKDGVNGAWHNVTDNSGNVINMTIAGTYAVDPKGVEADYRFGVPTGGYTSGTVVGVLERD